MEPNSHFDAYYKWLGIPPKDQPPNHYRLLGIELFEPDAEVIDAAAERQAAFLQQVASGDHVAHSQKLLNEVAQARLCLLDPETRQAYDASLKASVYVAQPQATPADAPPPARRQPTAKPRPPTPPPTPTRSRPQEKAASATDGGLPPRSVLDRGSTRHRWSATQWLFAAALAALLIAAGVWTYVAYPGTDDKQVPSPSNEAVIADYRKATATSADSDRSRQKALQALGSEAANEVVRARKAVASLPGLNLWLDAADPQSLQVKNGRVRGWSDQRNPSLIFTSHAASPELLRSHRNQLPVVRLRGKQGLATKSARFHPATGFSLVLVGAGARGRVLSKGNPKNRGFAMTRGMASLTGKREFKAKRAKAAEFRIREICVNRAERQLTWFVDGKRTGQVRCDQSWGNTQAWILGAPASRGARGGRGTMVEVAELLVFDRPLDRSARRRLVSYLRFKWFGK